MPDSPYSAPKFQDEVSSVLAPEHVGEIRGIQIITASLIFGACFVMGVALVINGGELGTELDILSWLAIGFAVVQFLLHFVIPAVIRQKQLGQVNVSEFEERLPTDQLMDLLRIYRGPHIIGCVLLEGAVFFNLIAFMLTEFVGNLAVAVMLLLVMAVRFPTQSRVASWLTDARQEIGLR